MSASWADTRHQFGLTATEAKLLDVLADGGVHMRQELLERGLGKRFGSASAIGTHMWRIKQKLAASGYVIVSGRGLDGYRLDAVVVGEPA